MRGFSIFIITVVFGDIIDNTPVIIDQSIKYRRSAGSGDGYQHDNQSIIAPSLTSNESADLPGYTEGILYDMI